MSNCTQVEVWLAAQDTDTLPPAEDAALKEHLAGCSTCRELAGFGEREGFGNLEEVSEDRYRIGKELARGGMGRIRQAEDLRLGREVAIKELLGDADSNALKLRFEREAMITARLQHPAIIPVYEAGRWPNGKPFYAMKRVKGRSLHDVIEDTPAATDRLALLPNILAIAEAVAFAHDRGVIHRDLKPENILVGDYGETVVIDWGLAKDLSDVEDAPDEGPYRKAAPNLTQAGSVIGTPAYMPPEQARGEELDTRADVYALGGILYHLLTGQAPYEGSGDDVLVALIKAAPRPLSELAPSAPSDLVTIVEKAMAREVAERYEDSSEFVDDLRRFTTGKLVEAHSYSASQLVRRWLHRNRAIVSISSVLLLALLLTSAISVRRIIAERDHADVAQRESKRLEASAISQSIALMQEQGRQHLLEGRPLEAAVYLSEAFSAGADSSALRYLLRQALRVVEAQQITIPGLHFGGVGEKRFSPDGKLLAAPMDGGDVRLWRTDTGQAVHTFAVGEGKEVLAWSGNSKRLALGTDPVTVWDVESGEKLQSINTFWATWALDHVGERLYASVLQYTQVWDVATGKKVLFDNSSTYATFWIGMSPDDQYLISSGTDGTIRFQDPETLRVVHSMGSQDKPLHIARGRSMQGLFDSKNRILVSGPSEGSCSIWTMGASEPDLVFSQEGEGQMIAPSFDHEGEAVVTGSTLGAVRLWSIETGKAVHTIPLPGGPLFAAFAQYQGEAPRLLVTNPVRATTLVINMHDGALLAHYDGEAVANLGGRFLLYGKQNAHLVSPNEGILASSSFVENTGLPLRPNDRFIVAHNFDQALVWDAKSGTLVEDLRLHHHERGWLGSLAPDGSRVLEAAPDGSIIIRATRTTPTGTVEEPRVLVTLKNPGKVTGGSFGPGGQALVVITPEALSIWDATTGTKISDLAIESRPDLREPPAVSSNAERTLLLQEDGSATLWNREGAKVAHLKSEPFSGVLVARFFAHGETFLLYEQKLEKLRERGFDDKIRVSLWKSADGTRLADLGEAMSIPYYLWGETDPSGNRLLYGGAVWDTRTGRKLLSVELESDTAKIGPGSGSFSDDGTLVAIGGGFGGPSGARVFEVATGRVVATVGQARGPVSIARLSPSGERLVVSSLDGATTLWDVQTEAELGGIPSADPVWKVERTPLGVDGSASVDQAVPIFGASDDVLVTLGPWVVSNTWKLESETRSPEEVRKLVERQVPFRLKDGRLERIQADVLAVKNGVASTNDGAETPEAIMAKEKTTAVPPGMPEAVLVPCSDRDKLRSVPLDDLEPKTTTSLLVVNDTDEALYARFVDSQGKVFRRGWDPVQTRGSRKHDVGMGDVYIIEDGRGSCITLMRPRSQPSFYLHRKSSEPGARGGTE